MSELIYAFYPRFGVGVLAFVLLAGGIALVSQGFVAFGILLLLLGLGVVFGLVAWMRRPA